MGMSFPLAVKGCVSSLSHLGYGVGRVYASNTIGAIVGSFLSGFVLIPMLGITKALLVFTTLNIIIAIALLAINPHVAIKTRSLYMILTVTLLFVILYTTPKNIVFLQLKEGQELLYYEEGPLDTVSVVQYKHKQGVRRVAVDGIEVGGTDPVMLTDQKSLAHLPMLLLKNPRSALTVGFGSGGTSWSFLQYKELRRLDAVEISPTILKAVPFLEGSNHGVLCEPRDPRLNIIVDDARSYLRINDIRYDIITTDCTDLSYKSNATLYTLEYFQFARKSLTQDGIAVAWMPLRNLSDASLRAILRTFYRVFPYVYIWYFTNYPTHYVLMLGKITPLEIDYQTMLKRLDDPLVKRDLAEINLDNPIKILSSFVTDQRYLGHILEGGVLNTDDYPYVEFYAPRLKYAIGEKQKIDNLSLLMNGRQSIYPYLVNIPDDKELKAKLQRYTDALPYIISGHIARWDGRNYEAYLAYEAAMTVNPEDSSVFIQMIDDRM
jgi:spermidine synthase